ncbi:hypothetical protein LRS11_18960 [Pseudomonas sp. J452]|uniref:toxin-antitoxin system YwqK family antitoxin n=1 Tax=Pseudomonas sp. J452 TaxID=2898441 RepID=UPI0021ADEB31|nr:hypothetical protein [Pseudomonas sp. J452]UUY07864.1 hypothetical protein LRS11_18960 [Pseudomonas sp. J452]
MKRLVICCALMILAATQAQADSPFYSGKTLLHPLVKASPHAEGKLAFFSESGEVVGRYEVQYDSGERLLKDLDSFDNARIDAVFYADLTGKHDGTLVMFSERGQTRVRAYLWDPTSDSLRYMPAAQRLLDSLTLGRGMRTALEIKNAIYELLPFDYSLTYASTEIAAFDQLNHSAGEVVAVFDKQGRALEANASDRHLIKKTFLQRDGRWLTARYVRADEQDYRFVLQQIAWEREPKTLEGLLDGDSVKFVISGSRGLIHERGEYRLGKRVGQWMHAETDGRFRSRGEYVEGRPEGLWNVQGAEGQYQNGLREGAWHKSMPDGTRWEGSYKLNLLEGPARVFNREGQLQLEEHYAAGMKEGLLKRYNDAGKLVLQEEYKANRLHGRQLTYADDGSFIRKDISYREGLKHGPFRSNYSASLPENIGNYRHNELFGRLQQYVAEGFMYSDSNYCQRLQGTYATRYHCGEWTQYRADGTVRSKVFYVNGDAQVGVYYYEDGTLKEQRKEVNGALEVQTYHPNGQLNCSKQLEPAGFEDVDNKRLAYYNITSDEVGDSRCYYPSGQLQWEMLTENGQRSCRKSFDENGKQTSPGPEGCPPPEVPSRTIYFQ